MTPHPRVATAATLVRAGRPSMAMPACRFDLTDGQWAELATRLSSDPIPVAGLWSDGDQLHALLLETADAPLIASVAVENRRALALSPARPFLSVAERILRDLWGIETMGARDLRPWLDHGMWKQTAPLSARPGPAAWPPEPPEFDWSAADAEAGAMQLPIGPVQSALLGPAQLRATLVGERVRRLEPLLGFNHRGVLFRLRGSTVAEAASLVGRIDAGACVAHQVAFAQAVETALGWEVDGATRALRQGMMALERIGALLRQRRMSAWRDLLLDGCAASFGHRMMRDAIVPGGWASPPDEWGLGALPEMLSRLEAALDGDVARPAEPIRREIGVARRGLGVSLPGPPAERRQAAGLREGLGSAETVHGPVWHWVRLDAGRVLSWHAADPVLFRLAELAARAPGATLNQLQAWFEAAELSAAAADQ